MRYADAPTTDVELYVDAPPDRVWELVTDLRLICAASPELVAVTWQDGATGPELGARFVGRNRHPRIGEWETTSIVTDFDRPSVFGWTVTDVENPTAVWRFTLTPDGAGTVVRQWARLGPGWSFLKVAVDRWPDKEERIVANRLAEVRTAMTKNLVRIKELAES